MLILADCGGSNSARSRVWKYELQKKLCDSYGLTVTVCHSPQHSWGFSFGISKNWAGKPLKTYETALKLIRTTKTKTGLTVNANFTRKYYELGEKISDSDMKALPIKAHKKFPGWNYTLHSKRNSKPLDTKTANRA